MLLCFIYFDGAEIKDTTITTSNLVNVLSAAWPSCSERRCYDDHDRKVDSSTPT